MTSYWLCAVFSIPWGLKSTTMLHIVSSAWSLILFGAYVFEMAVIRKQWRTQETFLNLMLTRMVNTLYNKGRPLFIFYWFSLSSRDMTENQDRSKLLALRGIERSLQFGNDNNVNSRSEEIKSEMKKCVDRGHWSRSDTAIMSSKSKVMVKGQTQ